MIYTKSYQLKSIYDKIKLVIEMESKDIYKILDQLYSKNNYKKIFINGPWGVGKSYYTNKYYKDNLEKNIIYISLFGKTSIDDIKDEVNKQIIAKGNLISQLLDKGKRKLHKVESLNISVVSLNVSDFGKKFLLDKYTKDHKDECVMIIIDDIERKSNKVRTSLTNISAYNFPPYGHTVRRDFYYLKSLSESVKYKNHVRMSDILKYRDELVLGFDIKELFYYYTENDDYC